MVIRHKEKKKEFEVSYSDWLFYYLRSNKYVDYEIVRADDLVELHHIDEKTGNMSFVYVMERDQAERINMVKPKSTSIENLKFKHYDKNLITYESVDMTVFRELTSLEVDHKKPNDPLKEVYFFAEDFWLPNPEVIDFDTSKVFKLTSVDRRKQELPKKGIIRTTEKKLMI